MGSNPNHHNQLIGLLEPDMIQDNVNSNGDGSNLILLPTKRKSKTIPIGKPLKRSKIKQEPRMSKSKQKKLKHLQEEKEKKSLHFESIRILEKYKLCDGAYSLLHSSGTIGQAETMKEKRRRAVQFSKAGLEVPADISPLKKKANRNAVCESIVPSEFDSDQCHPEGDYHDNDLGLANGAEADGCNHSQPSENYLKPGSKRPSNVEKPPTQEVEDRDTDTHMIDKNSASCYQSIRENTNSQEGVSDLNMYCQNMKVPADYVVKEHVNGPIVVHVSRPKEIEEKRKDLPIVMMEQEIMEAINEQSIVILCGETGCGKTTQVPQFLYEAGFGSRSRSDRKGIIGVTQPRRVAVLATSRRVSFELGFHLGKEVGFQVRHDKMIGDGCSIKFMTDGILLREVQSDFLLKRYSVIILDEAHERSLNTDILIGMLSRIINLRKKLYLEQQEKILSGVTISPENSITQLKIVLMSATLRVEDFISNRKLFLESPPVLEVPVRQFPVSIHFSKRTQEDYLGQAYKKVMSIHKSLPQGGILVFVTGQREIEFLCKKLRKASRLLAENNSKRVDGSEMAAHLEEDMKEINEAFDIGTSPDEQKDRFSAYEEENYDNPVMDDSFSSDSETESDLEHGSEIPERSGLKLDFMRDSNSLSSLKASFEALAEKLSTRNSKEEPSSPVVLSTEKIIKPAASSVGALYVLPLYAMLPASAQLRVFEEVPEGERLVVVATNVAETSLTIPGIKYVVDTGKEKVKNYNHKTGVATYEVQWISKASASQRAGRAGRTGPGHCYRLYSSAAFSKDDVFPEFSCPEISKIPVDGVVLLMKFMGINKVANFPFPTPPETEALVEAEQCLKALEALDSEGKLTTMGRAMAQYPMSPRHSRMLLTLIQMMRNQPGYARANFVLGYAVAAAAALSHSNPFIMQLGVEGEEAEQKQRRKKLKAVSKEARARFFNPTSDALTVAYALQSFELSENSAGFCDTNSLHLKTMEEMSKLRKQLLQLIFHHGKLCEDFAWNNGRLEDVELSWRGDSNKHHLRLNEEELLGKAICAGWADRVAKRVRTVSEKDRTVRGVRYQSCALKDTVHLHRWSSVSRTAPEFLVYTELLHAKRPYMHGATSMKPEWLIEYATSLCSFSTPLTDPKPYYDPLRDRALCWVTPTFGRHNWELPLHSLPIKNDTLRVCVFACAFLEGRVLPCLKSAGKFLAAPPSSILRSEGLGQRRAGDLLSSLKTRSPMIDSRAMLREAWNEDRRFLYSEIRNWFQQGFHDLFVQLWEQMQCEALRQGCELFPKRAKREREVTLVS